MHRSSGCLQTVEYQFSLCAFMEYISSCSSCRLPTVLYRRRRLFNRRSSGGKREKRKQKEVTISLTSTVKVHRDIIMHSATQTKWG